MDPIRVQIAIKKFRISLNETTAGLPLEAQPLYFDDDDGIRE